MQRYTASAKPPMPQVAPMPNGRILHAQARGSDTAASKHLHCSEIMPPNKGAQRKRGPAPAVQAPLAPLFQLPEHILARILAYITRRRHRATFRSVCRRARQLVNQNVTGAKVSGGSFLSRAWRFRNVLLINICALM